MICLMIIFTDLFVKSFTGCGFLEEPMLLAVAGCLEVAITLSMAALYQAITGRDLL